MKKIFIFSFLSILFLQSCSFLEQNKFIETKVISSDLNEQIIYKFYHMGINKYKVDFYSVHQSDSTKLFEHFINDALFSSNTYKISQSQNEIIIRNQLFSEEKKLITQNGKSIILTNR
ncbi:hypothetical protein [Chryseobacterium sp. G0201]|uniref:hypothetical protein n=1 Tax=Chryseobacterium sp. G0201 TaxID=2487065 RepID=UPI000F4D43DC|nr:hypothetical protein [Chryseobacterium sp. G0201]AZA53868.1 hypothetical protein EG348_13055 [Chryseobacterium sp. G0201]